MTLQACSSARKRSNTRLQARSTARPWSRRGRNQRPTGRVRSADCVRYPALWRTESRDEDCRAGWLRGVAEAAPFRRRPNAGGSGRTRGPECRSPWVIITVNDTEHTRRPRPVRGRLAELALQLRLPGFSVVRSFVEAALLMSDGPSCAAVNRWAVAAVDKILRGAKPADLPVEQPSVFDGTQPDHCRDARPE